MAHIVIHHVITQRLLGRLLIFARDGGVNTVAVFIGLFAVLLHHILTHHLGEIRRGEGDFRRVIVGVNSFAARLIVLRLGDIAFTQHTRQHHVATRGGAVQRVKRVKGRRRFRQTGNHRHFTEAQLVGWLTEVNLRRRPHAVGAVAEVDLVQIQLENFIFAQQLLDANSQERFLNFTHQRLFRAEEEVTRQLLSNGTGPLRGVAVHQRDAGRTEDTNRVNPMVLVEAAIFGGNECLHHLRRDLAKGHRNTAFFAVLCDELAVCAIDLHGHLQAHVSERSDVWQLRLNIFVEAINRACSQQNATDCKDE